MLNGKTWKYGDNVDTDVIIPARYLNDPDPAALASHCMEDIDDTFAGSVQAGDIMVGGWNFGCGSSREHAPISIQASGIACVIAASFARIFYRNALNIGFPILECPEAALEIQKGDEVSEHVAGTVIWTAGIESSEITASIAKEVKSGGRGRLEVDEYPVWLNVAIPMPLIVSV